MAGGVGCRREMVGLSGTVMALLLCTAGVQTQQRAVASPDPLLLTNCVGAQAHQQRELTCSVTAQIMSMCLLVSRRARVSQLRTRPT
jgi:hypothetical protein